MPTAPRLRLIQGGLRVSETAEPGACPQLRRQHAEAALWLRADAAPWAPRPKLRLVQAG